ncbi:Gp49 family protein [Salmonella enterica subsp. enterica serovar Typhi]
MDRLSGEVTDKRFKTVEDCHKRLTGTIGGKGKTAPRITPQHIEGIIQSEHYFSAYDGAKSGGEEVEQIWHNKDDLGKEYEVLSLLTFCVLVLRNGFVVTGESACASPENFDPEIGRKIARQNAIAKIWPLEGYLLKQQLHEVK